MQQETPAASSLLAALMQSPSLAASTGVLQADTTAMQDDIDLNEVDEILSQHSNQKSHHAHASPQIHPSAASISRTAATHSKSSNFKPRRMSEAHAMAPAGPAVQDTTPVIDLSDLPEQEPSVRDAHKPPESQTSLHQKGLPAGGEVEKGVAGSSNRQAQSCSWSPKKIEANTVILTKLCFPALAGI